MPDKKKKLSPHPTVNYETYFNSQILTTIAKLQMQKHYGDLKKISDTKIYERRVILSFFNSGSNSCNMCLHCSIVGENIFEHWN